MSTEAVPGSDRPLPGGFPGGGGKSGETPLKFYPQLLELILARTSLASTKSLLWVYAGSWSLGLVRAPGRSQLREGTWSLREKKCVRKSEAGRLAQGNAVPTGSATPYHMSQRLSFQAECLPPRILRACKPLPNLSIPVAQFHLCVLSSNLTLSGPSIGWTLTETQGREREVLGGATRALASEPFQVPRSGFGQAWGKTDMGLPDGLGRQGVNPWRVQ